MKYDPIIRHVSNIVPIILAASIIAVTVYRPPQMSSAPGVAAVGAPAGREHAYTKRHNAVSAVRTVTFSILTECLDSIASQSASTRLCAMAR